ncbi:YhfH family protein [Salibacterium salarium]|uniref:YhfH family protein n=1 Tax=Salibacterium salarium TaxID=284579 RepID=A0A428MSV4_9BACI|nr:YhfH family protein [Salibacterium salarium]
MFRNSRSIFCTDCGRMITREQESAMQQCEHCLSKVEE